MKTWGGLVGLALIGLVYSCGGDDDPYADLRDSPLLSTLPSDATALDTTCRKVEQFAASDYYACTRNYATDLDIPQIRSFHLPALLELGYEISIDGPQYQRLSRYLIDAIGRDSGASVTVADTYTTVPEFAGKRWTVVLEVRGPN